MKKLLLSIILLISSLVTSLQANQPQYGGVLVFGKSGDASTLDAAKASDGESFNVASAMFDNLVQFKYGSTDIEPALATSWSVSDDGLEYTFNLRKGVYFNQTKFFKKKVEFTADDVVFSLKRQFDKTNPFYNTNGTFEYWVAMNMNKIVKDVVKLDKYKVRILLNEKNAPFISNLAMEFTFIQSSVYANELLKKNKVEDLNRLAVGTGPFAFVKWIKDDRIIFKRNDNYWDGKPYIKKLIFKVIPNSTVRSAELRKGSIHIMDFPNPGDIAALEKHENIKLIRQEGLNIGYLAMNTERKPFDDVRVRQAINHAINKQGIVDTIYAGMGKVSKNPLPPLQWGYNDEIKDFDYSPEKAKALLKEAGLENGFETNIWAMPVARPYNPNGRNVAVAMQADLAKVGIKAKIVSYDWGTYLKKTKMGEHDMALLGWTGDNGDPDNFLYTLLSIKAAEKPASNIAMWKNKEFDALIQKAKVISDVEERTKLYKQAQVIFRNESPWVNIANSIVVEPVLNKVHGFKIDPVGKRRFHKVWLSK